MWIVKKKRLVRLKLRGERFLIWKDRQDDQKMKEKLGISLSKTIETSKKTEKEKENEKV